MAMIPDSVRPYWDFVAKYHFWLLAPLVPALVLPTLFMTNTKLSAEIASKGKEIDGKISSLKQVDGISPHPNDTWTTDIDKRTSRVKRETLAEWQRFWDSQADLQTWPAELGPDFLQRLANLRPGKELQRQLLERYQSSVRDMVKKLPARMGADVAMVDPDAQLAEGAGEGQASGPPGGMAMMMNRMMQPGGGAPGMAGRRSTALVEWNAADQQRLYDSFHWDKPPKTKQMLLAQEELRVYGLLCDQIAAMNQGAGGTYDAAIPHVEQLAVGYPACEDEPAFSTVGRMHEPGAEGAGGMGMGMGMGMGSRGMMPPSGGDGDTAGGAAGAGGQVKPQHPRFMPKEGQTGMGMGMGMGSRGMMPPTGGGEAEGAPAAAQGPGTTDEAFLTWIYVDADGRPLKGEEVATSPSALMTHLMPFTIRATIDQRKLDAFLIRLATSAVPIDIRQVRLNPPAAAAGMPGMGGMGGGGMGGPPGGMMMGPPGGGAGRPPAGGPPGGGFSGPPNRGMMSRPPMGGGGEDGPMAGMAGAGSMVRPHDIVLEIRGTIALATPPNAEALGLAAEGAADGGAAADAAEPVPAAVDEPAAPAAEPAGGEPAADGAADPAVPEAGDAAVPPADAAAPAGDPPAPEGGAAPAGDVPPPADQPPPAEPAV